MQSITTLNLNLQYPNYTTTMHAVQNDKLTRKITAILYDGANAWTPPSGSLAVVRFMKPDGTKGFYDTDENGHTAVTWVGNSATIMLAEQVLTVPGDVLCQLNFYNTSEEKLTTFLWVIKVQQSVVDDETIESTDYFNVLTHQIAEALAITAYPPYINNTTHNWMTYNVENEQYEDSGISAQGIQGEQGEQGLSIRSVTKKSGTGAAGTTDVYNVNLSDNTVAGTFSVYNGSDGQGAPSATMPLMDGAASVGIESGYARGDHRHPSDTTRVPTSRKINGVDLTEDRTLTAENIDYDDELPAHTVGSIGEELASLSSSITDEQEARESAIEKINALLASIENGDTATRNYDYREFVLWKGDLYVTGTSITSGTAFSSSNLITVSDGGFNEIQSRIGNLFASYTVFNNLSDLVASINSRLTGEFIIAKISSTFSPTFFEDNTTKTSILIINKASSNNAYYLAFTQDNIAIGNISLTSGTVTVRKDLAAKSNSLQLNSSISYPAYLTTGLWRTGSDGTINLAFPCTSLKESTNYTTTSTISLNIFMPGSADAATQALNQAITNVERITTDYIVLQIAAIEGIPINRIGFFSTRTAMTITAT